MVLYGNAILLAMAMTNGNAGPIENLGNEEIHLIVFGLMEGSESEAFHSRS
jgi:hypothetical protein